MTKTTTATETGLNYLNAYHYTDIEPYEVIRVISDKTIEVRLLDTQRDPTWKPDAVPGGFAGHVLNNHSQRWFYYQNASNPILRARRQKNELWKVSGSSARCVLSEKPTRFYDYNF